MTEEILKAADTHVEPARPLRVIHVEDFESAAPLSDGERDACRRRFTTLFADETRTRRGGLGRVTYVTNALGECYACKTLVMPGRAADEDAAACDRRDELLRIAFRKEFARSTSAIACFRASRASLASTVMALWTAPPPSLWSGSRA